MTYCGAKISYAVYLVMAEETVCFLCDVWMSSWDDADKWADRKTHHSLFRHIFFFFFFVCFYPVSLFFSCLEKQNKQELTDDPLLPIYSLSVRRPEPRFFRIYENMQMKVRLIQSSSESCDPSRGV